MLSQESIEQFEQAAELETHEEREKLQAMEKQKREFAKQLRETQDQEFKAKQQTKADRLKYLLKQSEIFTHFIMQKGKKGGVSGMEMLKNDSKPVGGKSSVSKRHQKKHSRRVEESEDGEEMASD